MSPSPFTVSYSEQDYLNASALHWQHAIKGLRFMRMGAAVAVIAGLFYGALAGADTGITVQAILIGLGAALAAAAFVVLMALANRLFFLPRIVRRSFRQAKEYQQPWTFTVGDDALVIESSRGNARLPYDDFVKWAENEKTLLVYRTERQFNLMPKPALSPENRTQLLAKLAAAGVPRSGFWNC